MSIYKPKSGIAFDIDGIVLDTGTEIWKVVTTHLELPWSIEQWTDYYIENIVGYPLESLRPVYEKVLWRKDLPMLPYADTALKRFYRITKEPILFITARRPQFVESAKVSIERKLPGVEIEVVGTSRNTDRIDNQAGHNKIDFLKDHGINFFVDDYPYSWEDYINAGVGIATLDWPWTRGKAREITEKYPRKFIMLNGWKSLDSYLHLTISTKHFVENHREFGT